MIKFSLLVRVHAPIQQELRNLVTHLENQPEQDWELVLVVDPDREEDSAFVRRLNQETSRVRMHSADSTQLLAWVCQDLLPSLGTWVCLLDQHDFVLPAMLTSFSTLALNNPDACVLYADECRRTAYGWRSFTTQKGHIDTIRLRSQEYLGAPVMISRDHLMALGIDRLASDAPAHDIYLRTLESRGPSAFAYQPDVLVEHYRTYLEPVEKDPKRRMYTSPFDPHAVRQHLLRLGIAAKVSQVTGVAKLTFRHPDTLMSTLVIVVGDDLDEGRDRIQTVSKTLSRTSVDAEIWYLGTDPQSKHEFELLAKAFGWRFRTSDLPLVQLLNEHLRTCNHEWTTVLQAEPLNWGWLDQLLEHARLPNVSALGPRTSTPINLYCPGTLGYQYEGWSWLSPGRFNQLRVPHETSVLGSGCLMFNTRDALELGGFNEDFPRFWAMDYSIRLSASGRVLANIPHAHVQVSEDEPVQAAAQEADDLRQLHAAWTDRFGLFRPW